jgi:tetratricopeptide (TPR) repeat protein
MTAAPLYLNIRQQGETLSMDLASADPVVPRGQLQVEDSLLTEIGEELARITTLANKYATLDASGAGAAAPPHDAAAALQKLGGLLFSHLFPVSVRQRLADAVPTDLLLRLDDQLVHVPWELAFDGRDFLLTKFRIGRQVITHYQRPSTPTRRDPKTPGRLKMLIITDPTESLPAAGEEAERLCDLLDACGQIEVTVLGGQQLRKLDLLQAINEYDLVHYAGHAVFDPAQPHRSGWVLHDTVLTAAELSLVPQPPLLVFANACQAGATTRWHAETVYESQAFGIGSAFLLAGTPNYIGTFCVIHDAHSATFAANFYRQLLQGQPLGVALAAARHQALQDATGGNLLWASYMHYGNPTFQLPAPPASSATPPGVTHAATSVRLPEATAGPVAEPVTAPQESASAAPPRPAQAAKDLDPALTRGQPPAARGAASLPRQGAWPQHWPRLRLWGIATCLVLGGLLGLFLTRQFGPRRPAEFAPQLAEAYQRLAQGDWQDAERVFQQGTAAATLRIQGQAYAGLAAVAFARRDYQQALHFASRAEALEPHLAYSHVIRGHILLRQGKLAEAMAAYQTATEKPLALPWQLATAHNHLGQIAAAQGEPQTALAHYDRAIDQDRSMSVAYANKGHVLAQLGQHQDALALYRQAAQLTPADRLTVQLLREAERRETLAQDAEKQRRVDELVSRLAQMYKDGRIPERAEAGQDDWTSAPLTLAVLPLESKGSLAPRPGFEEVVWSSLVRTLAGSGRLTLVEREILDKLLAEVALSASALADRRVAQQVGRLLTARLMLPGSVLHIDDKHLLSLRLVETDSSVMLAPVSETFDGPDALEDVIQRVAQKILAAVLQQYPLQGRIVQVVPEGVTLNLGARHGVSAGVVLEVIGEATVLPPQPKALLEVSTVEPLRSRAKVLQQSEPLQPGWKVRER